MFVICCLFFFFKQKTAYEMRISDWSSDVCSSDLDIEQLWRPIRDCAEKILAKIINPQVQRVRIELWSWISKHTSRQRFTRILQHPLAAGWLVAWWSLAGFESFSRSQSPSNRGHNLCRSEEPSELQSLMRISYAVFCLKKKKIAKIIHTTR